MKNHNNRLSLKIKITAVVLVPFIGFLITLFILFNENIDKAKTSGALISNIAFSTNISLIVHELQKERGMSVRFLNGGVSEFDLNAQRENVDKVVPVLRTELQESGNNKEIKNKLDAGLEMLRDARSQVSSKKVSATDSASIYTRIIDDLLQTELEVATLNEIDGSSRKISGLYIMESGKEYMGRFRAFTSAVLGPNVAISITDFERLIKLMAAIEINLDSPATGMSKKGRDEVKALLASDNWKKITAIYNVIFEKWNQGKFDKDQKAFFGTITEVINNLHKIIHDEYKIINDNVLQGRAKAIQNVWIFGISSFVGSFFLFVMVVLMIRSILGPMQYVIGKLKENSDHVSDASSEVQNSSHHLANTSAEQASSLEETTASLEEISAMIQNNAMNSEQGLKVVSLVKDLTEQGNESMKQLKLSMDEILEANKKIEKLVSVIEKIGSKTAIIDEIVFQTKLLSFNASVEAERAGEQGRGFAVVAQEVGTLAQMSGKAALEISNIVRDSQREAQTIAVENKTKVHKSNELVARSAQLLAQIQVNATEALNGSQNILSASKEQATGIKQINAAIEEINKASQENSKTSEEASKTGEMLNSQARHLDELVQTLMGLVNAGQENIGKLEKDDDDTANITFMGKKSHNEAKAA